MKNLTHMLEKVLLASAGLWLATGCMSAPTTTTPGSAPKEDPLAAARAKAYVDGVELIAAADKMPEAKKCLVPAAADKMPPVAPGSGQSAAPSKDWKLLIAHASGCVKEKNWKTLEQLANSIARIDIDSPWGAYFLSVAAEGYGDLQRAVWMADLAQKKAGGRSGLYAYQKGRVLFALKDTSKAMKEIERAVAMDERLAEGFYFLGLIHDRDQEGDLAMKNYEACLGTQPAHYGALTGLAELKLAAGSGADAAKLYQKAVETHPEQLKPWVRLAFIYETVQKDATQALATYKGLKSSLDSGSLHERPDFDLNAKIKTLETAVQARVPAQASTAPVPAQKSVK